MRDELTRRDLLKGLGGLSVTGLTASSVYLNHRLSTVPIETENLRMVPNAANILADAAPSDWRYTAPMLASYVGAEADEPRDPESLQSFNPTEGFTSTHRDGIAAGFTRTGRLDSLLFPHTSFTPQLPYYACSWERPLYGAKPWEGSFAGLRFDATASPTWLWEEPFTQQMEYVDDTGILSLRYETDEVTSDSKPLTITERAYVLPGEETLVRDFTLHNRTDERVRGDFVYHTQANVNDNQQTFVVWNSNENRLTATDALRWTDRDGPYQLLVYTDAPTTDAGVANTGPTGLMDAPLELDIDDVTESQPRYRTNATATRDRRATPTSAPSVLDQVVASQRDDVRGRYLSGYLASSFTLDPGDTQDVSVFLTGGKHPSKLPDSLQHDRQRRQSRTRRYWSKIDSQIDTTDVPSGYRRPFKRAVRTTLMHIDPESGSIAAGGTHQPTYYPSWPRDGAFASVALARAGFPEPAKRFVGEFLPTVQEPDGSFKQCYDSTGTFAGIIEIENDQQPLWAWAVERIYTLTGDDEFLDDVWDSIRAALEYTMEARAADGLLTATPDIQEDLKALRQSLWMNVVAYEGLRAGARLAVARGEDPAPYRRAATELGTALKEQFFERDGYVTAVGLWGPYEKHWAHHGIAVWPSEWAADYDEADRVLRTLVAAYHETGVNWTIGELVTATALYQRGGSHTRLADTIVTEVLKQSTAAGYVAAKMDDGHPLHGSPLTWASAQLVLALTERSGRA